MNVSVLRDGLRFASLQSGKRLVNGAKIFGSYQLSRLLGSPVHSGLPLSIAIEPTTSCNLRCPECVSGLRAFTRPTGMLDEQLYRNVIDQLAPRTSYLIYYFQGEPYLHPQFATMMRYARDKKMYTATSTNGHFLNDEAARETVACGLSRLIVSVDGVTQDVYRQYRVGGKLNKVLEGIENIVKWKRMLKSSTPHLILQFLVTGYNEHQIADVKKLGKKLGVDEVKLKSTQVYNYENGSGMIPKDERYTRYKKSPDGTYNVDASQANRCWRMWRSCVVTWDGNVVPCCFDKDASHKLGNLQQQSFEEIWNGAAYKKFRSQLLTSRKQIDICTNCSEGLSVWR